MGLQICYIMGAGEGGTWDRKPGPGDLVIAADGGYDTLRSQGITPDLVVGDFDSLSGVPDGPTVVHLPKEKDDTDMLAALRMGVERGYRNFQLFGGTGGRIDHTLANLQCLKWLSVQGYSGRLRGDGWTAQAVTEGTLSFGPEPRGYVSVFSMGERAGGVYLRGLKYPLEDAVLTDHFPLGVSNEFTGSESSITVTRGTLLVVYYDLT